jgi:uncharacterized protein
MKNITRNQRHPALIGNRDAQEPNPTANHHFGPQNPMSMKDKKHYSMMKNQENPIIHEIKEAISLGDTTKVETFLKDGADANMKDVRGNTLLHHALENADKKMLTLLLEYGANPDYKNHIGDSVIHACLRSSKIEALQCIVPYSKNLNQLNGNERAAIHLAITYNQKDAIAILLDHKADPNLSDKDGNAPIHSAIFKKDAEILELLLQKGADPNRYNLLGETPLIKAIYSSQNELLKILLQYGADPNLEKEGSQKPPLYFTVDKGDVPASELLIRKGAKANVLLPKGNTLLMTAISANHEAMVTLLLKSGTDVHRHNDFGDNPLLLCAERGNRSIMQLLLRNGANVNSQHTQTGKSALHTAAKNGDFKMVELLTLKRADINLRDKEGDTAITQTLPEIFQWWQIPKPTLERSKIARYLLDRGADIKQYETDNFFIAMLADTLNVNNPGYARNFIFSRVNNEWERLDARRVEAVLNQFSTLTKIDDNKIDKLLLKLLHPDIQYADDVQAARHSAHLRSWNGKVPVQGNGEVDAEGWWMHIYPPLKIKSLIFSLNKIKHNQVDCMKEFLIPKEMVLQKIKNEIAAQMSTYYSQRHHDMMRMVSDYKFKDDFKNFEASKYCKEIVKTPIGGEFALASGFPGHAVYFGFRKMNENDVARVVYNLGAGLQYHTLAKDGKAFPHVVTGINMEHFVEETPQAIGYLKSIIDAKLGLARDPYRCIYKDVELLEGKTLTENIPGIPQKRQLVGNCVLKNNNSAVKNRMKNDLLFKFLKIEEKKFADEISKFQQELIDTKERDKDIQSFQYVIAHFNQSKNIDKAIENTIRFLEKKTPGKPDVANSLREPERIAYYLQNLQPDFRHMLLKQRGAYFMLHEIAERKMSETLNYVIKPYGPKKDEIITQKDAIKSKKIGLSMSL